MLQLIVIKPSAQNHFTLQNKHAVACTRELFVCIWSRHLKLYLKKWSLIRFTWRSICFITRNGLVSSIQSLVGIADIHVTMPCCVTAYVFAKLSRNQSWVNLLFSLLQDSILDSILDSHRNQESRIELVTIVSMPYTVVSGVLNSKLSIIKIYAEATMTF